MNNCTAVARSLFCAVPVAKRLLADPDQFRKSVDWIAARGSAKPGWWVELGDAVAHVDAPVGMVDEAVVATAQRNTIVDAGGAVVGPVDNVVDVAPASGHGTAREGAAIITQDHCAANRRGDGAAGAPDVQWFAARAEHERDEFCVAGDAPRDFGVNRTTQRQ
jgi:hypothetical protein